MVLCPNISNIDYFIYSLKYLKVSVWQRERDYKIRFCGNDLIPFLKNKMKF